MMLIFFYTFLTGVYVSSSICSVIWYQIINIAIEYLFYSSYVSCIKVFFLWCLIQLQQLAIFWIFLLHRIYHIVWVINDYVNAKTIFHHNKMIVDNAQNYSIVRSSPSTFLRHQYRYKNDKCNFENCENAFSPKFRIFFQFCCLLKYFKWILSYCIA